MAKQLNVSLNIQANTDAAKKNLEDLFNSLNKISSMQPSFGMNMSKELKQASASAQDLEVHLSKAMDIKTGNINLSKLESSLNASNQSLSDLMVNLSKAGPIGQQSFLQVAKAVSSAGTKLTKTQGIMSTFLTTLKNTARWQLSSSLLHGFMGALQGSISYAEQLNKSLTNIRIVTGQSSEQMAAFAEKANQAAQKLSTTTTAYSDAALIYYQQGLSDKEVEERTNITVKMANVTKQSVEEVSSQMTALWNNFAKSGDNLERYADVLTKLGASTASSSSEISQGLSKFAAVADTVGLSYEKAAASIATVVAETRQSADTVGTAFKTMFARIQGLQLGETLEDGVTLNKYSEALKTVGVNILDSNKELKDMDTILDELGAKWNTIGENQQVALAETVAGVRQYTQFMSLMNNYDKISTNEGIANAADGTLQQQADTYAESWDGAQKRVQASLESIYNDMIPDDFLIKMTNGLADVIQVIDSLIDSFGGLPNILMLISSIILTKFAPNIAQGIDLGIEKINIFYDKVSNFTSSWNNVGQGIKNFFSSSFKGATKAGEEFKNTCDEIVNAENNMTEQYKIYETHFKQGSSLAERQVAEAMHLVGENNKLSASQKMEVENLHQINNISSLIAKNKKLMTEEQQQMLAKDTDSLIVLSQKRVEEEEILQTLQNQALALADQETESLYKKDKVEYVSHDNGMGAAMLETDKELVMLDKERKTIEEDLNQILTEARLSEESQAQVKMQNNKLIISSKEEEISAEDLLIELQQRSFEKYQKVVELNEKIKIILNDQTTSEQEKEKAITSLLNKTAKEDSSMKSITKKIGEAVSNTTKMKKEMINAEKTTKKVAMAAGNSKKGLDGAAQAAKGIVQQQNKADQAASRYNNTLETIRKKISDISNQKLSIGSSITQAIQGFSQLAMGINAVKNAFETLNDKEASVFDKLTAGAMGLSMGIAGLQGALKTFGGVASFATTVVHGLEAGIISYNAVTQVSSGLIAEETVVQELATAAKEGTNALAIKENAQNVASMAVKKGLIAVEQEELLAKELENAAKEKGAALDAEEIANTIAHTSAKGAESAGILGVVGAKIADTAAQWGLNAAMDANPVGLAIMAFAALALALAAVTAAIFVLITAESDEAKAQREANESLVQAQKSMEELSTAAQEAKDKATSLKDAFDKYDTIRNKLDSCTEGTQEWKDAMIEMNNQVQTMITDFPELLGKLEDLGDGTLGFSKKTQKEIQKLYNTRADNASNALVMGQADVVQKNLIVEQTKVINSSKKSDKYDYYEDDYVDSQADWKKQVIENADKWSFATQKEFTDTFKSKFGKALNLTGDELTKFYKEVQSLATKTNEAAKQIDNAVTLIAQNTTKKNYSDKSKDVQSGISNLGEKAYQKKYDEIYNYLTKQNKEKYNDGSYDEDLNSNSKGLWKQWLKSQNLENSGYRLDADALNGDEKNRTVTYYDADGKDHTVSYDVMAKQAAAGLAGTAMAEEQKKASALLSQASSKGQAFIGNMNYDSGKKEWNTTKAFEAYGDAERNKMQKALESLNEKKDVKKALTEAEAGKGNSQYKELLNSMGLTAKQFVELQNNGKISNQKLIDGIKNVNKQFSDADKDLLKNMKNIKSATAKEKKDFIDSYKDVKNNIENDKNLTKTEKSDLKKSFGSIKDENKNNMTGVTKFQQGLKDIDLTSKDASEKVEKLAHKYKISGNSVDKFIKQLDKVEHHFSLSTKSINKTAEEINSVAKDLKIGDTIKKEDLDKLKKAGVDTSAYFSKMSDGTYQLTNSAKDFQKAVKDITLEDLKDKIKGIADSKTESFNKSKLVSGDAKEIYSNTYQESIYGNGKAQTGASMVKSDDKNSLTSEGSDYVTARLDYAASFAKDNPDMFKNIKGAQGLIDQAGKDGFKVQDPKDAEIVSKMIDKIDKQQADLQQQYLSTSTSITELKERTAELAETSGTVDYQAYSSALIGIASQYDNTKQEIEDYQEALENGNTKQIKAAEDALTASTMIGEAAKKYSLTAEDVETQAKLIAKNFKDTNNGMEMSAQRAARLAIANQRMNKGVKSLNENWSKWSKELKKNNHTTKDYAETLNDANDALADLVGAVDGASIPVGFLDNKTKSGAKHLEWMSQASKGNVNAINKLGAAVAAATLKEAKFKDSIKSVQKAAQKHKKDDLEPLKNAYGQIITENTFKKAKGIVNEFMEGFQSAVAKGTSSAQSYLDNYGKDWVSALNEMAYATGMTVDEMNATLNEMGVDVEVVSKPVKQETSVPEYTTIEEPIPADQVPGQNKDKTLTGKKSHTYQTGTKKVTQTTEVAQINAGNKAGTAPKVKYVGASASSSGTGGVSSSSTSGSKKSGSGDKKNTSAASHEHEVHRYTNEENKVKGLTDEYNRLVETKDRLYGASRIQAMDAEIKKLEQLKKASKSYLKTIVGSSKQADKVAKILANGGSVGALISRGKLKGTIGKDYKALFQGKSASGKEVEYTAKKGDNEKTVSEHYNLGMLNSMMSKGNKLNIKLDKFGNIKNEDALLKKIQNEKNKENDRYSQIKNPNSKQETDHNRKIAYLDEFKERLSQYKDTASKLNEKGENYIKQIRAVQDARAEKIIAKMNNGVELGQKTQQKLQRSLKVLGDSIYKSVEGMQKWWNNSEQNIKAIRTKGDSYDKALQNTHKLSDKYFKKGGDLNSKAISPAKAAEAYKQIEEGFDALIDELLSDIETKKGFYGKVMEQWATKISNVDSAIQSNITTLEHYQKTMELLGKSNDYNQMGIVLKGQMDASKMNYEGKKAVADTYEKEYADAKDYYQNLLNSGKKDEADLYYESVFIKAQEKYLQAKSEAESALQSALESVNTFFENEVNRIFQESEDRLTGKWGSFDALDKAMKRQQSIAEEYLTKTNQLYETNKMLRTLQKDMDKTDNQVAKTKLKAFSDEINAMQKREKLTKTDLQIAKARYEVLQAQIALEEAQNAKSTVRLQRDNEGNYGYVYTADQNKVSDAEQTLEDKQNALYNIGLEASQKYAEKLVQIRQEYDNAIQELLQKKQEGLISQEEYEMQLADINEKYRELELTYTEEYNSANQVLNEVGAEGQKEAWTSAFSDIIEEHKLFSEDSISEAEILTEALDEKMKWLDEQRAYWTNEAKVGNKDLQDSVNKVTGEVKTLTDEEKNLATEMGKNLKKANELTKKFVEQYKEMEKLIKKYQKAADEANKYYQKLLKLTKAQKDYNQSIKDQPTPKASGGSGSGSGGDGNNGSGDNNSNNSNPIVNGSSNQTKYVKVSAWIHGTKGVYYVQSKYWTGKGTRKIKKDTPASAFVDQYGTALDFKPWNNIDSITKLAGPAVGYGYDTGGYTGSWSGINNKENGKLAFLHQKELVLNADDTENILAAVQMIRQISQSIDLSALAQSQSLQTSSIRYNGEPQTLQQEVTIHAEFPNATDHNEIEQAFDNLVNRATQYAYRENNNI